MELTYMEQNGLLYPNLSLPDEEEVVLGPYAMKRRTFLMEHRPITFTNLLTTGRLNPHLMEIEAQAGEMKERLIQQLTASYGLTEELKAQDQMEWVRRMNNLRQQAEEMILADLIYN